ncbi:MAG: glycerate kinase [Fimbriimonadia bacterium]|nr:glycerate kinase [Fimbriimonadia bacterium]
MRSSFEPMNILVAPTAFKGTLSPLQAARAIQEGLQPHVCDLFPVADGGNGWIEVWRHHWQEALSWTTVVRGPLRQEVEAEWLHHIPSQTAIIESAAACGLHLLETLDPMNASTEGVGDLICAAYEAGCREIWLGLGGSASTDVGVGALRAVGYEFLDTHGNPVPPGGAGLSHLRSFRLSDHAPAADFLSGHARLICATDVQNPLFGEQGAAFVFAPQKGASPSEVLQLDQGLRQFASLFPSELSELPGGGAAGGLGAGLAAGLGAKLISGIEWLFAHTDWQELVQLADLIITGEGRVDSQTWMGKGIGIIAQQAVQLGKPVWILSGSRGEGWEKVSEMPGARLWVCADHFPDLSPYDALKATAQMAGREL